MSDPNVTAGWASRATPFTVTMACGHDEVRRMKPSTAAKLMRSDGSIWSQELCAECRARRDDRAAHHVAGLTCGYAGCATCYPIVPATPAPEDPKDIIIRTLRAEVERLAGVLECIQQTALLHSRPLVDEVYSSSQES